MIFPDLSSVQISRYQYYISYKQYARRCSDLSRVHSVVGRVVSKG